MKEVKLSIYDKFKCTADKCGFTCCQQWKIAVDKATEDLWNETGKEKFVYAREGMKVIKLDGQGRCPLLLKNGLCSVVIEEGDDAIPYACRIFPRQEQMFEDRMERTVVSCCPEVVNLLNDEKADELVKKLNDWPGKEHGHINEFGARLFDARREVINIVIKAKNIEMGLMQAFCILKDLQDDRQKYDNYDFEAAANEVAAAVMEIEADNFKTFAESNEILLDVCDNYRKQGIYSEYIDEISDFAEEILSDDGMMNKSYQEFVGFLKAMDKFDGLVKKYVINEIFSDGITEDSDMGDFTVMLEWIIMEYVVIRQAVFLYSGLKNVDVDFEIVKKYIVVISRMMGYERDDIYEYLENSFEEMIWSEGYAALALGVR